MKKATTTTLSILFVALLVSLYANVYQHNKVQTLQRQTAKIEKENTANKKQLNTQRKENSTLRSQINSAKTAQNNAGKSQSELNFNRVSNKFLSTMFTFNPNSYNDREKNVKGLISEKLYNQYFPKNNNFGDANSVTSKLDTVNIYTQSEQNNNMNGLAVITFESKSGDADFKKETVLYQLKFNTTTNQLSDVQNLGSGFKATNVQ